MNRAVLTEITHAHQPTAPWGWEALIDVHGCHRNRLADEGTIRRFVPELTAAIGMTAYGPLVCERFGCGPLYGWSAYQLIETSNVSLHADEPGCRLMLNVFSCKEFDPRVAARLAVAYFGGTPDLRAVLRGGGQP